MLKHFRFFAAEVWILIVSTLESLNVASQRLTNLCGFVTYSIKIRRIQSTCTDFQNNLQT